MLLEGRGRVKDKSNYRIYVGEATREAIDRDWLNLPAGKKRSIQKRKQRKWDFNCQD